MVLRIHQLSPAIANQIAAGEVIERPASVVKELLENSLDAGASVIGVDVNYGGLLQITVSDNGSGISGDDLPLAVAAHATSKIRTLDDLYSIDSMGFRGEALASIASVAKVTIISKPEEQDNAMMLRVEGENRTLSPCARNIGTTIDVSDLFYNAPVRKRFLKNEKLEFQAIEMVVKRFALSAPRIALTLKHNKKLIFSLPPALSEQAKAIRMGRILGNTFMREAIFLDVEHSGMRLYGWISNHRLQRSQNDRQWIYVNQRMVKDKLLQHAVKQAYDGLLHAGRFPICLLYFTLPASEVDVNVHPTKHEVRFQQPRLVHDFFTSQLTKALQSTLDHSDTREYAYAASSCNEQQNTVSEPSHICNDRETHEGAKALFPSWSANSLSSSITSKRYKKNSSVYHPETESQWVILNERFILVFIKQQPYLADIVTLFQEWIEKQLMQKALPLESRPLLISIRYPLPNQWIHKPEQLKHELARVGIQIEYPNADDLLIRSIPLNAPYLDVRRFFNILCELDFFDTEQLIALISRSQMFAPKQLTVEERIEMNQVLLELSLKEGKCNTCKALTIDDCRMLLHE
ncbi:DNA mismatch repair endonuclease MutL [Legionella pneumophila]|uniref:DNA mismatch repair endonuclease MutL n=1 Tax=Legionella pneumophila TaxID=446 RepID=UPI001374F2C8|nr:DNA mismatch repair endonuclease MutL [Legionella pneumophila]HAT8815202.1 DNA mismatch repair endonuclease MutL [Legionella pneumophila subsp. pneumophila]MCZ4804979.1 DNA mismatch repair endonuclease MutL [Legionella pneumophila]MDW9178070.1 DNA mismatch repair endonuclease MutL [Legionella pneumophila]HAT1823641.1 DNA mismatch repair endonuclease MutL [Legionella pneumophila]HAT1863822.1 DNA mismatch repair endonuclease MutL [Legionella pneumophila]